MEKQKRSLIKAPIFKIALGLLFVISLVLLFLPQLSSTSWISGKIKQTINEKIPGTLDYTQLTISWLNGLQINELVYDDKENGSHFTIEEISTSKGLLSLATNYKDVGVINVKKPQIVLSINQKATDVANADQAPATNQNKSQPEANIAKKSVNPKSESTEAQPLLPPIHVQLHISDGNLVTIAPDNSRKTVLEKFNVELNLDVPNGGVDYQLSFNDATGAGEVKGKGKVFLPDNNSADLNTLASNAVLEITDWQIADMLDIAANQAGGPQGEGIINGLLRISGTGNSTIGITGNLKGRKIQLRGGSLQGDTPSIDDLSIDIDVQKDGSLLEIKKLEIQSPFVEGVLTGSTSNEQLQTLNANAKINAAKILSQFPETLKLQDGVRITEGLIDIKADVTTAGTATVFDANVHLDRLTGSTGKKNISWKNPVDLLVQGNLNNEAITLDKLTVESSFLQATGSGNADAMKLQVAADIGSALKEVEQFVQLGGWTSQGKLDLEIGISNNSKNERDVTGNIKIANFELIHNKTVLSPTDTFTAAISSNVQLDSKMEPRQFNNTKIDIASWLGSGSITAEGFTPKTEEAPAVLKNGVTKGTFNLERITTLLHSLKSLPEEQNFTGTLDINARMNGDQVEKTAINLQADVSPFTFTSGDKEFSDEKISIDLEATANLAKQDFTITSMSLSSTPVALTASGSMHPKGKEQTVQAEGTTTLDFKSLGDMLKAFADLQLEMSGVSEKPFNLDVNTSDGKWTNTVQNSTFSSALQVDKITGYGLEIESLALPVNIKDSFAEIDLTALVNRGEMAVKPQFDFTGSSPVVTLPDNSTILKEVGLTGAMSNDLLSKVHPLFKGVASSVGTISLDMQHLNWPMDKERQKEVTFAGAFTFNDVKLQAGAMLTPLLVIMKTDENEIQISEQPMTFIGKNERVTCSPLEATVNTYSIILEGSIGFDQSLDYIAKIPITRKMVSGDIYKYLEGTYISVPLTGTVSKPSVSKSFVQKALGDLVIQAGKKQLGDQAGKLLQKLFQ